MARKKQALDKLNETGERKSEERRSEKEPVNAGRRKVQRRRQIDPTTCERDYNNDEIEFMHALDEYKRASGRMFPTCSEILEVLQKLGYQKVDSPVTESSANTDEDQIESMDTLEDSIESLEEVI